MQEQLDALVGPGMTIVSVDAEQFILYVTTNIENANVFREVIHKKWEKSRIELQIQMKNVVKCRKL